MKRKAEEEPRAELGTVAGERLFAESLRSFVKGSLESVGLEKGQDAWGGTGLFASRVLTDGVRLSVPRAFILDVPAAASTVLGKKLFAAGLSPGEILLVVLAVARQDSGSPYAAFAETLPVTSPDPLCWASQAQALLVGTDLGSSLPAAEEEIVAFQQKMASSAFCTELGLALGDLRWARGMILSRRFPAAESSSPIAGAGMAGKTKPEVEESIGALAAPGSMVPTADLFNHSHEATVTWTEDSSGPMFTIENAAPLEKGQESFINYGSHTKSNEELLAMYGFARQANPNDAVSLRIVRPDGEERLCYIGREGMTAQLWEMLLEGSEADAEDEDEDAAEAAALAALRCALVAKLDVLEEKRPIHGATAGASGPSSNPAVSHHIVASVQHYRQGLRDVLTSVLAELDELENELS